MAKKINLPKAYSSAKGDLITVLQNGVEKNITKKDLLKYLEDSVSTISKDINSLQRQISRKTIDKNTPSFNSAISAKSPKVANHLTTKGYVDTALHNVVKNDGTTKLVKTLSYRNSPPSFTGNDVVTKNYIDSRLQRALKTVISIAGLDGYPEASMGDTFIVTNNIDRYAVDGPEIQEGDLLICLESSVGGAHSAVGHQFAILNTNIVNADTTSAGIIRVATEDEVLGFNSDDSAVTPVSLKTVIESGSEYSRIQVVTPTYSILEEDKGIIGVDTSNHSITLTLPSIGRLLQPKIVKYVIKDESDSASKNTIKVVASGGNTIQGKRTVILSTNGESLKLYNDGSNKWYKESNVSSSGSGGVGSGVKTFNTSNVTTGERALTTGAYESVMSIDIDLSEYPIGTGFKVVSHCKAAATSNAKKIAIGLNGSQKLESSLTGTTSPNDKFIHHELTVMNSDTPTTMAFGFVMIGADDTSTGFSNDSEFDWNSIITISLDVLAATAATDVDVYALQILPLR